MIEIGKINKLRIVKAVDFGLYLDGGDEWDEILLPNESVPEDFEIDQYLDVFIYFDSEDRIIATTHHPTIQVGEVAYMRAVSNASVGAFMDWGLRKDLLVPFREQREPIEIDQYYLVYAYLDKSSNRIVGSTKIDKYIDQTPPTYEKGDKVSLLVARLSPLGAHVIVNNSHWGLVHQSDIFGQIKVGDKIPGYIKNIREDEKIDIAIKELGYGKVLTLSEQIIERLKENNGILNISDKSSPEIIALLFNCSKKSFKQALGKLYKDQLIIIESDCIKLNK